METEVPLTSLSQKKLEQLQNMTADPRMYIFIEKFDLDPTINAVVYDIEVGIQKDTTVYIKKIQRRYSALREFDEQIRPLYKGNRFLHPFPPKKLFGNKDKAFLDERAIQLQRYLTNLVKVTGITTTPTFCRTFEINQNLLND